MCHKKLFDKYHLAEATKSMNSFSIKEVQTFY